MAIHNLRHIYYFSRGAGVSIKQPHIPHVRLFLFSHSNHLGIIITFVLQTYGKVPEHIKIMNLHKKMKSVLTTFI